MEQKGYNDKNIHTPTLPQQCLEKPVRNTLLVTREIVSNSLALMVSLIVVVVLLGFLSVYGALAPFSIIITGIILMATQIYIGKAFRHHSHMDSFIKDLQDTSLKDLLSKPFRTAVGAYLGWAIVITLPFIAAGFLLGDTPTLQSQAPLLILILLFAYLQPLITANIIASEGFKGGMLAVFSIFSTTTWKRAFNRSYFRYFTALGVIIIAFIIALSLIIAFIALPLRETGILPAIGYLLNGIISVLFTVFSTVYAVVAYELTGHENHAN